MPTAINNVTLDAIERNLVDIDERLKALLALADNVHDKAIQRGIAVQFGKMESCLETLRKVLGIPEE